MESGRCDSADRLARWEIYNEDMFYLWDGELQSMGSPDTLSGFVQWGFENHSAQRYGLVL